MLDYEINEKNCSRLIQLLLLLPPNMDDYRFSVIIKDWLQTLNGQLKLA